MRNVFAKSIPECPLTRRKDRLEKDADFLIRVVTMGETDISTTQKQSSNRWNEHTLEN